MAYIVIASFQDTEDNKRLYEVDQSYPREGYEPSEERIEALSTTNNRKNKVFIEEVTPEEIINENEFPKQTKEGSSWYELSNGEKVQGKEEAIKAENELKSGE